MGRVRKKKSRKKKQGGWIERVFIAAILIGLALFVFILFRQDLPNVLKPKTKKAVTSVQKKAVTLYFSDQESEYLIGEKRDILRKESTAEEAEEVMAELSRGPKGELLPTLPSQTRLLALNIDERGVARVNFNRALARDHPGGSSAEIMTVYSIVNSLTFNFAEIKRVQILIEGKEVETIRGHLSLEKPLPANPSLIRNIEKGQGKH
jgi:spore germination protein GerM